MVVLDVQDSISALVQDCDLPSLKRNKNVQNFLERCKPPLPVCGCVESLCHFAWQTMQVLWLLASG